MSKNFSNDEIKWLKENYTKLGAKECAKYLGRSVQSIKHKLSRLGIKKYKNLCINKYHYKCSKCSKTKHIDEFSVRKNNKPRRICKECRKNQQALYYNSNRQIINQKQNARLKSKRREDPCFLLISRHRKRLRSLLSKYIKNSDNQKSSVDYLGCSIQEYKKYIESKFQKGMTWDNMNEWHIDHIVPCSWFDLNLEKERRKCFHYSNTQPMWAKINLSKRNLFIG